MCGRTGRVLHKGSQPWGQRVPGPGCACAEEEGPVTNLYVAVDRPSAFGPFSLRPCLTTSTWEVLFCPRLSPESPLHTCLRLREFQLEDSEKRKAGRVREQESFLLTALLGEEVKGKSGGASEGHGWGVHRVDACRAGPGQSAHLGSCCVQDGLTGETGHSPGMSVCWVWGCVPPETSALAHPSQHLLYVYVSKGCLPHGGKHMVATGAFAIQKSIKLHMSLCVLCLDLI